MPPEENNIEQILEAQILQTQELWDKLDENYSLLEALIAQWDDDSLIEAQIVNDNENTEKLVWAIKELKPELEKSASSTDRMVNFLEKMKGEKGDKGDKWDTGDKGEKGDSIKWDTGEKGETGEKWDKGDKWDKWETGENGKDWKDGIDGIDWKDGKNGKDWSPDTGEEIVTKLEKLKGNKRLDIKAIKGIEKLEKDIQKASFTQTHTEYDIDWALVWYGTRLNLKKGTGVTMTGVPNSNGVDITINASGGGTGTVETIVAWTGISVDSTDPANPIVSSTITQYTDEMAQDAVWNSVGNWLDYDDTTGAISVDETELTHNSLGSKQGGTTNEYYHLTSAQHTIVSNTTASFTTTDETKLDNITVTQAVNLDTMESDIAALANGMVYKGNWDASAWTFPWSGSAKTGWFYTVSVWGTVDSVVFNIGDRLIATTDNASTTTYAGNWTQLDATDAVTSVFGRTGNVTATNGDYTASNITNVPAGGIAWTDVQTALNELDTEKSPKDDPTFTTKITTPAVRASTSAGILLEASNWTDIGDLWAGNTANVTWYWNHNYDTATADTIASFGASKTLSSLSTATYPSLTELSYVKGVTSAIQTQLDGKVDENVAITWATKTKITYDAKGLVTSWADATTADISDSSNKRYVTDAQLTVIGNTSGTNTGDQTITNSSDATSHTVTLSASGGSVQLIEGSGITLTTGGTGSAGTVTIAASGGSGATTALDNLASVAINTSLVSDTDNTDDLGTTLKKWANLFITNIGATATRVTKGWFTDIESTNMPTVWGNAILTSRTDPQFTTIELWHASDTTLSRVSAGVVAVEGKTLANFTDGGTFAADISVPDEAYGSGWNGSAEVPTKNAIYDKIQTLSSPTCLSIIPRTQTFTEGSTAVQNVSFSSNTTMNIGQVIIPFAITANKITIRVGTNSVNGTVTLTLYSEDWATQIFSVTTDTITTSNSLVETALSSVVIPAWVYYFAVNTNSTTNIALATWGDLPTTGFTTTNSFPYNVTGKAIMEGTLTITASTAPATISTTGITIWLWKTVIFRLDN